MSDIFDDLIGGGADAPLGNATPAASTPVNVLVVPEKAPTGQSMHVEEMVYRRSANVPQVIFESVDPDTAEVTFDNSEEWRRAMHSLTPVSVEDALAWFSEHVGAVYEAHRTELAEAYFAAIETVGPARQAPGSSAVQARARMPHSTGRDRGQKR
ncbi:hypothetical protein [Bradyrhizobium canariense]|uniref:Uncharacterized protein n=1 Tax=Bradyrhizobium canariense TaxID=255045 RepID=A0A1X3GVG9_9BRAD|nr:hypothetical protein [Bradyrhizobium canariense]OSI70871.1 hypothetical protein BSZ22_13210 [Bradyrhizobium canariense]OSI79712.1 hypothetical protein BSZ23_13730 [Bradyrhizobium canariense]OSI92329.1 hypothetical protein BSZ25_12715 [Bradyrhizobium canariense]OSI94051.1 hypothetical protein BSZ24_11470 [Bradyrhizobium canariense]OSJ01776.1 hypothetical protein BSZ18_38915 [Bradyrhizobium canariense]